MRLFRHLSKAALATSISLVFAGCGGGGFDSAEKIKGLRVLAVQKDPAYPAPGDDVNLKLLYWDGKATEGHPRDVEINFFPCFNPPADLYYNCYKNLLGGARPTGPLPQEAGASSTMDDAGSDDGSTDASSTADDAATSMDTDAGSDASTTEEAGDEAGVNGEETPDASVSSEGGEGGEAGPEGAASSDADHVQAFHFTIPTQAEDAQILHDKVQGTAQYGLAYVLFTVCAGHIGLAPAGSTTGLPVACFDDNNEPVGPDDFVPGYTSLYLFDSKNPSCTDTNPDCARNANPVIDELRFGSSSVHKGDADPIHIPRCTPGACPELEVKAVMQPSIAEIDPSAKNSDGSLLKEQMWVAFYTTAGSISKPLRLVNDATTGWNEDNATKFTPPAEPGPLRFWAIVHDNRGGVEWVETNVIVD